MDERVFEIIKYFPPRLKNLFFKIDTSVLRDVQEIRLKSQCPILIYIYGKLKSVSIMGGLSEITDGIIVYDEDIDYIYSFLTRESVYAYSDEINNCFITADGGHRAGLSGTAIIKNGEIFGLKDINGIYFRVAHQICGCADEFFELLKNEYGICNTIIVAAPGKGKTTLLREIARKLSSDGKKVVLVDERREIAAVKNGIPSFDLAYCDVLDGFQKIKGIEISVRSLSPHVMIFDEIGNLNEADAISSLMNCGVNYVTTAHAKNLSEAFNRPVIKKMIDSGSVDLIVLYDLGKIVEYKYLKDNFYDKNHSFDLDFHRVHSVRSI